MMIKGLILSSLLLLAGASTAVPQGNRQEPGGKTDFRGVWIPQAERDQKPDGGRDAWTNVIVEQHDGEVKFTLVYPVEARAPKKEFTFYTDARGETNKGMVYYFLVVNKKMPDEAVKSETRWDGAALVTLHHLVYHDGLFTFYADLTMRWEVSADGKTLIRTTKTSNHYATYRKPTLDGDVEVPLPASGAKSSSEDKDAYILLEAKR